MLPNAYRIVRKPRAKSRPDGAQRPLLITYSGEAGSNDLFWAVL
jgi:hypothetical protein